MTNDAGESHRVAQARRGRQKKTGNTTGSRPTRWRVTRPSVSTSVIVSEELTDVGDPRGRVFLPQCDQPSDVVALEHHQAQHVVRARFARTETAREEAEC